MFHDIRSSKIINNLGQIIYGIHVSSILSSKIIYNLGQIIYANISLRFW